MLLGVRGGGLEALDAEGTPLSLSIAFISLIKDSLLWLWWADEIPEMSFTLSRGAASTFLVGEPFWLVLVGCLVAPLSSFLFSPRAPLGSPWIP